MNVKYVEKDSYFVVSDNETIYKKLCNKNELLNSRITLSEEELSVILKDSFGIGGNSLSSLKKMRAEAKGLSYIQLQKKGRILYPLIFIYEYINEIEIANKATFIEKAIENIIGHKRISINQLTFSELLGVKSASIKNWLSDGLIDFHYINKNGKVMFKICDIVKWILLNSKMTTYYLDKELEEKIKV